MTSAVESELAQEPGMGSRIGPYVIDRLIGRGMRTADLSLLKADWHFDPLRSDSRFTAIEARMNYQP